MEDHNPFLKSCILQIWQIVLLRLISYPFRIWGSVPSQIETGMFKDLLCEMCFDINWLSPNITPFVLMSWPLREIYFYLQEQCSLGSYLRVTGFPWILQCDVLPWVTGFPSTVSQVGLWSFTFITVTVLHHKIIIPITLCICWLNTCWQEITSLDNMHNKSKLS